MCLAWLSLAVLSGCVRHSSRPSSRLDLQPFKEMARTSTCAEERNRLYLIDHELVFWDRAGSCSDAAYAEVLFGSAVDRILCERRDTIGGMMRTCRDARFRDMFDTMTANLSQPDLGLGPTHKVEPIGF